MTFIQYNLKNIKIIVVNISKTPFTNYLLNYDVNNSQLHDTLRFKTILKSILGKIWLNFPISAQTVDTVVMQSYRNLMDALKSIVCIRSQSELRTVKKAVDEFCVHLPGPVTPEKLTKLDRNLSFDWSNFTDNYFDDVLYALIEKFDENFQDNRIFTVDNGLIFLGPTLNAILNGENLKKCDNLLREIILNETILFATFVDCSLVEQKTEIELFNWNGKIDNFIQNLVALPNKVANIFQRNTDEVFLPEYYSRILLQNALKAIYFIGKVDLFDCKFQNKFLSSLLSRIFVDFQPKTIEKFFKILNCWLLDEKLKCLIKDIVCNLNRNAILPVASVILKNHRLFDFIGDDLNGNWNFVIMQKIPLFKVVKNDEILENLVHYVAQISDTCLNENKLKTLAFDLINLWSSKTSINRTAFEQHLYVTKQLILTIAYWNELKTNKLMQETKVELRKLLFLGIQNHLECPAKNMRCVGMITSEVIMGILDGKPDKEEEALKFDYDGFDAETMKMVNFLKNLPKKCKFLDDSTMSVFSEPENVEKLIGEFMESDGQQKKPMLKRKIQENIGMFFFILFSM